MIECPAKPYDDATFRHLSADFPALSELKKMQKGVYHGYVGEKRRALIDKFGCDTKNASHLIRILRQGIDFIRYGELEVYRSDAEELLEIKRGVFTYEQINNLAESLEWGLEEVGRVSPLPEEPDWDAINKLAVHMYDLQRSNNGE